MTDLKENPSRIQGCCARVSGESSFYRGTCSRKGKYLCDEGKPYCKQHHPTTQKARDTAWRYKFDCEWAARKHGSALNNHNALALDVLKKIADGDNNPRVTAQEFFDERTRLQNLPIEHYLEKD